MVFGVKGVKLSSMIAMSYGCVKRIFRLQILRSGVKFAAEILDKFFCVITCSSVKSGFTNRLQRLAEQSPIIQ